MFWEPVWGGGVNERFALAAADGYLIPALIATGRNIWIVTRQEPQGDAWSNTITPKALPRFAIALDADIENYWKSSSHWKTIKSARRHTEGMALELDAPGAAAWTIKSWARRWHAHEAESDILLAADYLQSVGRYHTFTLRNGPTWVAGCTYIVDGEDLLAQLNYYDPLCARKGVQTRLDDLVFAWAVRSGLATMDLGYSNEINSYKRHWAPRDGTSWLWNVAPAHVRVFRGAAHSARAASRTARSLLRQRHELP
jgi:hypothetical protein